MLLCHGARVLLPLWQNLYYKAKPSFVTNEINYEKCTCVVWQYQKDCIQVYYFYVIAVYKNSACFLYKHIIWFYNPSSCILLSDYRPTYNIYNNRGFNRGTKFSSNVSLKVLKYFLANTISNITGNVSKIRVTFTQS